jgi:hypothetical protein
MNLRPRISILTALLLMTILGMAIVIWQLWHKVGPLQTEVKQLREERGTWSSKTRRPSTRFEFPPDLPAKAERRSESMFRRGNCIMRSFTSTASPKPVCRSL